jgi:hypothetical protein
MRPTNMRRAFALLLVLLPLTAAAGDLQQAIAKIPEYDLEPHDYNVSTLATRASEVLIAAVNAHEDVVAALERELKIPAAAARPLDQSWTGSVYEIEKTPGGWIVTQAASYIT